MLLGYLIAALLWNFWWVYDDSRNGLNYLDRYKRSSYPEGRKWLANAFFIYNLIAILGLIELLYPYIKWLL